MKSDALLPCERIEVPCMVAVNGWAGRTEIKAYALHRTPKTWRVRFEQSAYRFRKGEERSVPKRAVRLLWGFYDLWRFHDGK